MTTSATDNIGHRQRQWPYRPHIGYTQRTHDAQTKLTWPTRARVYRLFIATLLVRCEQLIYGRWNCDVWYNDVMTSAKSETMLNDYLLQVFNSHLCLFVLCHQSCSQRVQGEQMHTSTARIPSNLAQKINILQLHALYTKNTPECAIFTRNTVKNSNANVKIKLPTARPKNLGYT